MLATSPVATLPVATTSVDDGVIDRAFVLQMSQIPFIAAILVACSWLAHAIWSAVAGSEPTMPDYGPVIVVCLGMLLCAFIDGWAFKVPNWLTLSLVVSGWALGILHGLGSNIDAGVGGFGSALLGTCLGFILLFPILAIGGMGQGDVKMQMGFGTWIGAYFGREYAPEIIAMSFIVGVLVGGVFGLVMMACRRNFHKNISNFKEIGNDLKVLVTMGPSKASQRAGQRRSKWDRLPYGVPLCVGFLGYLAYLHMTGGLPG